MKCFETIASFRQTSRTGEKQNGKVRTRARKHNEQKITNDAVRSQELDV